MTERTGVVVKLATPIRMLPTTERCRLISAHKKYPAQAELSQDRFKVSEIGDLRGERLCSETSLGEAHYTISYCEVR